MEFLTCVVAAEDDEYLELAQSNVPLDKWSGIDAPGLDTAKIATLHSLLTGDTLQASLDCYEPVFVSESDNETLVLRIDDELFEKLTVLNEDTLENIAIELASTEAYENEAMDEDDIQSFLLSLGMLAQLAESQGQALFILIKFLQD